jgi:hypothetical protein
MNEWQVHSGCGEPIRLGGDLNGTPVGGDNPPGYTQTQTATFDGLAVAGISSEEGFEHARQDFSRDTRAGIGDGHFGVSGRAPQAEGHSYRYYRLQTPAAP